MVIFLIHDSLIYYLAFYAKEEPSLLGYLYMYRPRDPYLIGYNSYHPYFDV